MRVALVLGFVAACYSPAASPGSPCSPNGACPTGLECRNSVCELPGGSDGGSDAPIDVMVDACPGAVCSGDQLVACGGTFDCDQGCSTAPEPHCRALVPSNQVTTDLLGGATADLSGDGLEIDTSTGEISMGATIIRAGGTGLISGIRYEVVDGAGVFAANSFTLATGHRWDIDGSNPLVLFSATTITLAGEVDATASLQLAGAGGTSGSTSTTSTGSCRGRAGRLLAPQLGEGGGGGGGVTAGGNGGASNNDAPTGAGGTVCTGRSSTRPLRGGSGGGAGAALAANAGGGGGGAVALVAMESITIASTGVVSASGGGGRSGTFTTGGAGDAGGGGGSGGAVLLEAPRVVVTGAVTANGGSGASPSGVDGADGAMSSIASASGGQFTGPGGTAKGGDGGARNSAPSDGGSYNYDDGLATATSVFSRGAGGGGAAGRIEIRASSHTLTGAVFSPAQSLSTPDYE